MQELAAETPEAELVEAHAQFAEHLWDQTMDVLQRAADGLASTKELVVFFRKRASAEQDLAMSMRKMCLVCTAHPSLLAGCATVGDPALRADHGRTARRESVRRQAVRKGGQQAWRRQADRGAEVLPLP